MSNTMVLRCAAIMFAMTASAAYGQGGYTISGTVSAPKGVDISGTQIVACSVPFQDCKTEVKASVINGSYTLKLPHAGPYQIVAWKDTDSDGDSSPGDYMVAARDGAGIRAPAAGLALAMWKVEGAAKTSASANADVPALAGSWSQSSNVQELVVASKIKLQPAIATGYGTNLGGTFGPGSATNTTIVTEPTPMMVKRNMALAINRDGTFRWTIRKVQPEGKSCTVTVDQVKTGRVVTDRGKITFATTGGTDSFSNSCGKKGSSAMKAKSETYDYTRNGNVMTVKGSGGVNWTFRRG